MTTAGVAATADSSSVLHEGEEEEKGAQNLPPRSRARGLQRDQQPKEGGARDEEGPASHAHDVEGFFLGEEEGGPSLQDYDGDEDANNGGSGGGSAGAEEARWQGGGVGRGAEAAGAGAGGAGGQETATTTIASPRKKQRLRNLRLAKGMERAREKDIAVVGCWIPSVP